MPRALHHPHTPHSHRHRAHASPWPRFRPSGGAEWAALALLAFGLGLIGYAILNADELAADAPHGYIATRPSTYD